jgi:anti-sigma regulatory factor (Ser/Thr protein kinase)
LGATHANRSTSTKSTAEPFRHEALFYGSDAEFVAGTSRFVEDALHARAAVVAALPPDKIELLRGALDGASDGVHFVDMHRVGVNPGAIISAWHDFLAERAADGRPLWGIGEPVWPERTPDELDECHRHECLINLAFADTPAFRLICPYDTSALGAAVIERARLSHPVLVEGGAERASERYGGVEDEVAELLGEELPEPDVEPAELIFHAATLPGMRRWVADCAGQAGLADVVAEELVLAVNEAATNSVRYAEGTGLLRFWDDGDAVIFEIRDSGRLEDPLAGRLRPPIRAAGGHGLWLVNQLCELVQVRSSEQGTVVRLHARRR